MTFTYSYWLINGGQGYSLDEGCAFFTLGLGPEQGSGYWRDSGGAWLPERANNHQVAGPLFTLAFQMIPCHSLPSLAENRPRWLKILVSPMLIPSCTSYSVSITLAAIELKTVHWKALCQGLSTFVASWVCLSLFLSLFWTHLLSVTNNSPELTVSLYFTFSSFY